MVIGAIGFVFLWIGLRENLFVRVKVGAAILVVAVLLFFTGLLTVTPTEHAKKLISGFVQAAVNEQIDEALVFLSPEVIIVDDWKGESRSGHAGIRKSLEALHRKHTLSYNTILRMEIYERQHDVLTELSMFTRVSRIGSVPSRWRILAREQPKGTWSIYSIDAVEIAGRSYR